MAELIDNTFYRAVGDVGFWKTEPTTSDHVATAANTRIGRLVRRAVGGQEASEGLAVSRRDFSRARNHLAWDLLAFSACLGLISIKHPAARLAGFVGIAGTTIFSLVPSMILLANEA